MLYVVRMTMTMTMTMTIFDLTIIYKFICFGLDTVNKSSNIKIYSNISNSFIGGYYDSDKINLS